MSHGVHAVQHEVEHKIEHDEGHHKHADENILSQNKRIALLIAVIALCLAFSETLGKSAQTSALLKQPDAAADTMGHIPYFARLRSVAKALQKSGNQKQAAKIMSTTVEIMKHRKILASVIEQAEQIEERLEA